MEYLDEKHEIIGKPIQKAAKLKMNYHNGIHEFNERKNDGYTDTILIKHETGMLMQQTSEASIISIFSYYIKDEDIKKISFDYSENNYINRSKNTSSVIKSALWGSLFGAIIAIIVAGNNHESELFALTIFSLFTIIGGMSGININQSKNGNFIKNAPSKSLTIHSKNTNPIIFSCKIELQNKVLNWLEKYYLEQIEIKNQQSFNINNTSNLSDKISDLERLEKLRDKKTINQEEFVLLKKEIINA